MAAWALVSGVLAGCTPSAAAPRTIAGGDVLRVRGVTVRGRLLGDEPVQAEWVWGVRVTGSPFVDPRDVVAVWFGVGSGPAWTLSVDDGGAQVEFPASLVVDRARWSITVWTEDRPGHTTVVDASPGLALERDEPCLGSACRYVFADPAAARTAFAFDVDVAAVDADWMDDWREAWPDAFGLYVVARLEVWVEGNPAVPPGAWLDLGLVSSGTTAYLTAPAAAGSLAGP